MIPAFINGPIAPVFTAFDESGRLDEIGQRAMLDYLSADGSIAAFFVRSGMGRMYAFDFDEVKQIARVATDHMKGHRPVLVGTSGIWDRNYDQRPDRAGFTRQAVELSGFAESVGAAACVLTLPEAIAPERGEAAAEVTLRYFETVSRAVTIPVIIYQPPGTHPDYLMTPELLRALAALPNVVAMKASTPDAGFMTDMIWAARDRDFAYIVGHETAWLAGLMLGARAVIGGGVCVNPQLLARVEAQWRAGDVTGAMVAQRAVNFLCANIVNPVAFVKRLASEAGWPVGPWDREQRDGAYGRVKSCLSDEAYAINKQLLTAEMEKCQ